MYKHCFIAVLCAGLMAVGSTDSPGQDSAPAAEIFIGGSKLWERAGGGSYHNHGPEVALTGNFNRFLGLEMELVKFQGIAPTAPAYGDNFRLLFGPHFAYQGNSRVSPFAHALVGLTRGRQCPLASPCALGFEEVGRNAFTVGLGGGLDVKVFRFFRLRPIQADYVHAFFPNAPENDLQLSFGVTMRFGGAGRTGKH